MATEITMPKLSDTMTEGRLVSWKKSVGEKVERGDVIAEVETDKANMELESFGSGVLLETRVKSGDLVEVGTVIGVVGKPDEKIESAPAPPKEEKQAEEKEKAKAAPPIERPEKPKEKREEQPGEEEAPPLESAIGAKVRQMEVPQEVKGEMVPGEARPERKQEGGEPAYEKAAPVVRRLAREKEVDLGLVKGSGPEGRILKEDVERFLEERQAEKKKEPKPEPAAPALGETRPLSKMRAAIAKVVSTSWDQIPHFTVTVEADMEESERVVRGLREAGHKMSVNDLLIKASAVALGKFPLMNASFADGGVTTHVDANIGIAVAVENGLLVPVLKKCQELPVTEVGVRSHELIERARAGHPHEEDFAGGTFTISNLGMFGVEEFMAVIFPPQAAILAVGAVADKAVVRDGAVIPARMMKLTVSADHRVVDGAYAARFMGELKKTLENPVALLV